MLLQQLSNENRKQAKRDAGREDMKWQVNVEVHDPEIGLVSAISSHATGSFVVETQHSFLLISNYVTLLCLDVSCYICLRHLILTRSSVELHLCKVTANLT